MFDQYFDGWEEKSIFEKEYISLWSGWLGKADCHLLDQVTEEEWSRFNSFISSISQKYKTGLVDCNEGTVSFSTEIVRTLSSHTQSMNKDASQFSKYVIPEMECVITEEWDYTYIIWHKNNGAVEALIPDILDSKLQHFSS
ncbi:MAG: hypothetical protein ABJ364_08095 [Lentilitoribacter sp.]